MVEPFEFGNRRELRDRYAVRKGRALAIFVGFFFALAILGGVYGYIRFGYLGLAGGLFLAGCVSYLACLVLEGATEGASSFAASLFYLGRRPSWTRREMLAADIQKARVLKTNERYGEALTEVDRVLKKDPRFPEALYLKAEILWQGFESPAPARECLEKLLEVAPSDDPFREWGIGLYKKIKNVHADVNP